MFMSLCEQKPENRLICNIAYCSCLNITVCLRDVFQLVKNTTERRGRRVDMIENLKKKIGADGDVRCSRSDKMESIS